MEKTKTTFFNPNRCNDCNGCGWIEKITQRICQNCVQKHTTICYLCENTRYKYWRYTTCNKCYGSGTLTKK